MTGSNVEVWATDSILLCFDGKVLEIFGRQGFPRFHVAEGLSIEISEGRRLACNISTRHRLRMSLDCDVDRIDGLRELARTIEFAIQ